MRRSTKVKSAPLEGENVALETKLRPNLTCMVQGPHDALTALPSGPMTAIGLKLAV